MLCLFASARAVLRHFSITRVQLSYDNTPSSRDNHVNKRSRSKLAACITDAEIAVSFSVSLSLLTVYFRTLLILHYIQIQCINFCATLFALCE